MSTTVTDKAVPAGLNTRVLNEGYGPGAWHGADLKAALGDVTAALAFWRPAPGRHNIAEIALHHAFCVRGVRGRISGVPLRPFVMEGDDWFALPDQTALGWPAIKTAVEAEHRQLETVVADVDAGRAESAVSEEERFGLVLGITCHAVYHAGQIQLIKRLRGE